jgi:uncharacterized protein
MRPFSLLIKPASGDCNLNCSYCFYLGTHAGFYPEEKVHRMSLPVLEMLTRTYLATPQASHNIAWQGGEPTIMGLPFFEKAVELQKLYMRPGGTVVNTLQTNGTLLNDAFAAFLAREKILTGISLDGPKDVHDHYRHRISGGGSYDDVMRGIRCMEKAKAEFNILTLVNDVNVRQPERIYKFLCEQGFLFHQYIPCVEPDGKGGVSSHSVSGEAWGDFLCAIFDLWLPGDTRRVSIRQFDAVFNLLVTGERVQCTMCNDCAQYLVVEYNGDIYPCDFFVEKAFLLGNVMRGGWSEFLGSPVYRNFGAQKLQTHPKCAECPCNWLCVGDCLKHRFCNGGGTPRRLSHLCAGWQRFYEYALPRFVKLAEEFVAEQRRLQAATGTGPNDPCACGSGRKRKKCCGSSSQGGG